MSQETEHYSFGVGADTESADAVTYAWERLFIDTVLGMQLDGFKVKEEGFYPFISRSSVYIGASEFSLPSH